MTKTDAKQFGAIATKQFKTGHLEATFDSVGDCARFRSELVKRNIIFTDRFALKGKGITFRWSN